jgi:hypothetical protein
MQYEVTFNIIVWIFFCLTVWYKKVSFLHIPPESFPIYFMSILGSRTKQFWCFKYRNVRATKWYYHSELISWVRHFAEVRNALNCQTLTFLASIWPVIYKTVLLFVKTNDIFEISTKFWVDLYMFQNVTTTFIFLKKFSRTPPQEYAVG